MTGIERPTDSAKRVGILELWERLVLHSTALLENVKHLSIFLSPSIVILTRGSWIWIPEGMCLEYRGTRRIIFGPVTDMKYPIVVGWRQGNLLRRLFRVERAAIAVRIEIE